MALPPHLARYDLLIDLIVDMLVREIEAEEAELNSEEDRGADQATSPFKERSVKNNTLRGWRAPE